MESIMPPSDSTVRLSSELSDALNLSQELVDLIIDELSDDRPALNACSLTSRSWVYRSQYRLHRHLRFLDLKHLTSDPLRYSHPAVARYVFSLELATLPTSTTPSHCSDRIQIWVALARFSQVRRLTIQDLEDATTVTPFIAMAFPHVTELTLGTAEFDSFAQFKSFFTSFAHVTRFQLNEFDIFPWLSEGEDEDVSEDEDDYLEFPRLQHLTLSGRSLYSAELIDLATWLRSELRGYYSLRSLTFETWYGGRFGTMKAYLAACRRSLEVLELPMGALDTSIARLNFKRLGIKRLTKLRTVTFVSAEHPWAMRQYNSDCVFLTLAEITSEDISQVILDFTPTRDMALSNVLDFGHVDEILSLPQFTRLKFVDVHCSHGQEASRRAAEDVVRTGLMRSVARGIVRLDFGDFKLPLLPLIQDHNDISIAPIVISQMRPSDFPSL